MTLTWRDLLIKTVRDPHAAGEAVMAIEINRRDIWLAVAAVAALNAVFSGVLGLLSPAAPQEAEAMPILVVSPLPQALLIAGLLVLLAYMLTWVGGRLGGSGNSLDFLKLMVWMQFAAMVLQAFNLVILLAVPVLGSLVVLAIVVVMLRVLVVFVQVGHDVSLGNAVLILFATFVGMVLGLSFLLTLLGAGSFGVQTGV